MDDEVFGSLMDDTFGPDGAAGAMTADADPTAPDDSLDAATADADPTEDDETYEADEADGDESEEPGFDWDSDDNPYRRQALEAQRVAQQEQERMARLAQAVQQRLLQKQIAELPDLEPDAMQQQVQQIIAAAVTPYQQAMEQARQETFQTQLGMVVDHIAGRFGLSDNEKAALYRFERTAEMEQFAAGQAALREQLQGARTQAGLRQAAQSRKASGADAVGSSPGQAPARLRPEDATNQEDYFAALFGSWSA